jgi:hypothetical protein
MVAGSQGDDAPTLRWVDLELIKSELQRGLPIGGIDGAKEGSSGTTDAVD